MITESVKDTHSKKAVSPVLIHPDFHTRNIFVARNELTEIMGVID